jgi:DNA-binding transcriptional MerR regulator
MAIQQLDLFAAFQPPPQVEKEPEVQQVVESIPEPVIHSIAPVIEEPIEAITIVEEPVAEELIESITIIEEPDVKIAKQLPVTEAVEPPSIIFRDDNISVKIKPKVIVQQPLISKSKEVVAVKPKSKRGRKSYKEIDAELDLVEVPEEEVLNQKLYYSITEVARWFKVNASLLRYWENEFDILKPRKNRKGDRLFRPEDIKNLQVIYYLLRNRKFSLEGAKKYLRNHRQQADVNVQLAQSLTKFRSFLLELKANLGA